MLKIKIKIFIISIVVMAALTGCQFSQSATQKYINAFNRTKEAKSMISQSQWEINLNLSKASEEVQKSFRYYKNIRLNVDRSFNLNQAKEKVNIFFTGGDFAANANIYINGNDAYLKSIFTGDKYLNLNSLEQKNKDLDYIELGKEFQTFFSEASDTWKEIIKNEIIESEGSTIINTPDGDIKATKLTLSLTDDKFKNILDKMVKLVLMNEEFKKLIIESNIYYLSQTMKDVKKNKIREDVEKFFSDLSTDTKKIQESFEIKKLKLTAMVDKDSYIISEKVEGKAVIKTGVNIIIDFVGEITRWDINKNVKIEIPDIKKNEIIEFKNLKNLNWYNNFFKKFID